MKHFLGILIGLMGLYCSVSGQNIHPDYVDGQLYVRLKSSINPHTGKEIHPATLFDNNYHPFQKFPDTKYKIKPFGRAFKVNTVSKLNATLLITFDEASLVESLIASLKQDKNVELVERVPVDKRHFTPNDPSLGAQWHLSKINAANAWDYFTTGSNVVIAIVDDAVERFHPDLQANIWINANEIPNNSIDDDNNGFIDDVNGWDFGDNDNTPDPPNFQYSHGTHVAGISSGVTNNNVGIASIGYSCKLMCIKVAAGNPNSFTAGYAGVLYAANTGANIINCSWGSSSFSATNQDIIQFALSKGCIVVASAGNSNSSTLNYPAAYPGVISVASTDINDVRSGFSTFGEWVKISAPGSSILSTIPFSQYGNLSGTSMASPMVAGLLGLMKSLNPGMPNNDLINCLYSSADNINNQNPGFLGQLGVGRINANAAMACVAKTLNNAPIPDFTANITTVVQGGSVLFSESSIYTPTSWVWSFPGGTPSTFNGRVPPPIVYNTSGKHDVTLTVSNAFGQNTKTRVQYITVNDPPSCVSINFPIPGTWTVLDYLAPPAGSNGFQNGVNAIGDKQKAMFFDVSSTNLIGLTGFYVRFNHINEVNPNKAIRFRIFDGTTGVPGAELGVFSRTKMQIRQNVQAGQFTMIDLPKNIDLPTSKKFFISVDISELSWTIGGRDSLSIRANLIGNTPGKNPIWDQKADGSWKNYGTDGTWQVTEASLLIHPFLTSKPAKSIISPLNLTVCERTRVDFDATGSVYNDLLKWDFPGATPPTTIENQLLATPIYTNPGNYKIYLSTRGGCNETRIDSTTLIINPSPNVVVSFSKNPICLLETATITASGATTYSWNPSTGLNTTSGSQVLANPANSTNYTVTGTTGNCATTVPFSLEVRERGTSVNITASNTNITGPTLVTFTASAVNGGLNPNYDFRVNEVSVQSGVSSTLQRTVSPGDKIKCVFTSSEPCVIESQVVSNEITMGETTVPVTLIGLKVRRIAEGNQLIWSTASESNSEQFDIEKSKTGQEFEKIGQIAAAGNSNSLLHYTFIDEKSLTGFNYYRLKMIDKDATFRYSNTVVISDGDAQSKAKIYPNPTYQSKNATLIIQGLVTGRVNISILNLTGQQLISLNETLINGTLKLNLSTTQLPSGSYFIVCRDEKGKVIQNLRWQILD